MNIQMNTHFCFMIQCIIEDYDNVEKELFNILCKTIKQHYPYSIITLRTNETYWKYQECRDIIYGITLIPCIEIKELISYFPIAWHYIRGNAYSIELKKIYLDESAVWSKNCNLLENFLLPKVEWIHIYTWLD